MQYNSAPSKRDVLHLSSLIGEKITVVTETVDYDTAVLSIAVASKILPLKNGQPDVLPGVCFALRRQEMQHLRDALTRILTPDGPYIPQEPA